MDVKDEKKQGKNVGTYRETGLIDQKDKKQGENNQPLTLAAIAQKKQHSQGQGHHPYLHGDQPVKAEELMHIMDKDLEQPFVIDPWFPGDGGGKNVNGRDRSGFGDDLAGLQMQPQVQVFDLNAGQENGEPEKYAEGGDP